MTKRKIIRKSNRLFSINSPRYYSWGGDFMSTLGPSFNGANIAKMLQGGIVNIGAGLLGGAVNSLFGSSLNQANIGAVENSISSLQNLKLSGDNSDILSRWDNQNLGISFDKSDIGKEGLFSNTVTHKYNQLKKEQSDAIKSALNAYSNSFNNNNENAFLSSLAGVKANGGPLVMRYSGLMSPFGNRYSDGGKIHIKKANRGKFTKYCGGKVTSECIAKGKRSSDPAVRKRATFAANARKWKHAFGGDLLTHGAEWDNGITYIGNGGTHEENPFEGIQMGVDNQGIPNLVEEGEVIYNDYVFSNRIAVPEEVKKKYKLRGNTFADIAKNAQKESEERPNDPISKRGLDDIMSKLELEQEAIKSSDNKYTKNKYPYGGFLTPYYEAPDNTMYDLMSDRSVYSGDPLDIMYGESKPYRFGAGVTQSGEWIEKPKNMARAAAKRAGYNVGSSLEEYNKNPIASPIQKDDNKIGIDSTLLRYAPVLGSAIGLAEGLISSPDYSRAKTILKAADNIGNYTPIKYNPIGNYLTYKPFDRDYYINKLNAQSGATRRAILNTTSPSRNAALLAADYNALGKLGDLARQAEEYNLAQRQAVETFNRGTNMTNSEMGLKAAMANQEAKTRAKSLRLSGVTQAMAMKDEIDARRGAGISANFTNLFDSLGNIGIDAYNRGDRNFYINHVMGANLPLSEYKRLYGKEAAIQEAKNRGYSDKEINNMFSKGGKLKKRKGGLTY